MGNWGGLFQILVDAPKWITWPALDEQARLLNEAKLETRVIAIGERLRGMWSVSRPKLGHPARRDLGQGELAESPHTWRNRCNIHGNLTAPRVCQCPTGLCSKQWVNHTTSLWWVKLPWRYGWINHMNLPRTKCKQTHTKHTSKTLSKSYGMISALDVPVPNTCSKHTLSSVCLQMLHGPSADTVLTIKLHVLSGKFLWEKVFRFTLDDQMGS